jgi:ubiquinone biosynthesis protein
MSFASIPKKEIDLHCEADHAELFAVNFSDNPNIIFPKIYRELSTRDVLCMEYINGLKPTDPRIFQLYKGDLEKIIDLGVGSIIKMLYQDGFFHADLHGANLLILPGPKISFIDLGMVGRFDENTKRRLLYYFYALVNGDIEGSTKHLMAIAKVDDGGDAFGFKRAASDLFRRYLLRSSKARLSLAQIILESLAIGGKFKVFFPVEMTLMVKALVTFEGVGYHFEPNLDIPKISKKHVQKIFLHYYSPEYIVSQLKRGLPEFIDAFIRLPETIAESSRLWNKPSSNKKIEYPIQGIKSGLITGSCIVGGVMAYIQGAHPALWISLFVFALIVFIFGKS